MQGFYGSNPEPPHNPSGKPTVDFGDRVGGFEEDDTPQRIWGINDINSGSGSSCKTINDRLFTVCINR